MDYKVSVVVPVYKVEKYLHRCVESIRKQTYANLEIVLVDDGSPDRCGKLIDEYARKDPRIKALHKQNGGLSDARNYGMQYVTGQYTLFVDSDDWIAPRMIEMMVEHMVKFDADMVQTAFYYAYDDHLLYDNRHYSESDPPVVMDKDSAMAELVSNGKVKNFAWGKLFRTVLIRDIPFKQRVLFEDIFWTYQVIHQVSKCIMLYRPLYYYFQRNDSIVANYSLRNLDMIRGLKERHSFIEQQYEGLIHQSRKEILKASLAHYLLLMANRRKDKGGLRRKEIRKDIMMSAPLLGLALEGDKQLKLQLRLFRLSPYLYILFLAITKVLRLIKMAPQPAGLVRVGYKSQKGAL